MKRKITKIECAKLDKINDMKFIAFQQAQRINS